MYKSILILPDQHVQHNQNLRRFDALGNLIDQRRPDYVVNMGDMGEFQCLYGISGKRSWTFKEETEIEVESDLCEISIAHNKLFGVYKKTCEKARKNRKKLKPLRRVLCYGNHDIRALLFYKFNQNKTNRKIDELFDPRDFYDEIYAYQVPVEIEGILFSHNFVNGTSTASTVDTIAKLAAGSAVGAHSHKGECSLSYNAVGRPTFALQPGWFYDPEDPRPDWVGAQGGGSWWNGVTYLHGVDGSGYFDPEFIGINRLLKEYS